MWELRWILLGLGVLLIGAVYLWSRRRERIARELKITERTEPGISEDFSESLSEYC